MSHRRRLSARRAVFSIEVPPFATPALCHTSACVGPLVVKPIVSPWAWAAGLPSMGLVTREPAAIVRVKQTSDLDAAGLRCKPSFSARFARCYLCHRA